MGPTHWPSWILVALIWLLGKLPRALGRVLIRPVGPLAYRVMRHRRQIARRNIEMCFPDKNEVEHESILRGSFRSLARMLIETAWCWSSPPDSLKNITSVEGLEHLQDAEESGQGVLVLTFHSTCMEMGGFILCDKTRAGALYRPLKSPVIEWYQNRCRKRYCGELIKKNRPRGAIRLLREGGVLWYAPDQDFGREQSEFAPFFGIQTATLLATHRLPVLTGCAVIPMFPRLDEKTGNYIISLMPAMEGFPSDDVTADLTRINAIMEEQIRSVPEQYWWIHRRFKTRPPGEAAFYS